MKTLREFEEFDNANESKSIDSAVDKTVSDIEDKINSFGTVTAKVSFINQLQKRMKDFYKEHSRIGDVEM